MPVDNILAPALRADSAARKYPMSVAAEVCPVSAMVSPKGTFWRAASVTKPERNECAAKVSGKPASAARALTMSRTAAGTSGSPIESPRRIRRKIAPCVSPLRPLAALVIGGWLLNRRDA